MKRSTNFLMDNNIDICMAIGSLLNYSKSHQKILRSVCFYIAQPFVNLMGGVG